MLRSNLYICGCYCIIWIYVSKFWTILWWFLWGLLFSYIFQSWSVNSIKSLDRRVQALSSNWQKLLWWANHKAYYLFILLLHLWHLTLWSRSWHHVQSCLSHNACIMLVLKVSCLQSWFECKSSMWTVVLSNGSSKGIWVCVPQFYRGMSIHIKNLNPFFKTSSNFFLHKML